MTKPDTTRAEALTSFANPKLLHFLAAAARAEIEGRALGRAAGLDGANLALFRAVAIDRGFLDHRDLLTPDGRAWMQAELEPFAPFLES